MITPLRQHSKCPWCFCPISLVFIGFPLVDRAEQVELWELEDFTPKEGDQKFFVFIDQKEDRSVASAVVALGLFPSKNQVKKNRPDLFQTFGPDDIGEFTTSVGNHRVIFIVGFETEEAATRVRESCKSENFPEDTK